MDNPAATCLELLKKWWVSRVESQLLYELTVLVVNKFVSVGVFECHVGVFDFR